METCNVLLVALGNIGFRHFQALLNCHSAFELHVVDISDDAVAQAKAYAADHANGRVIHYYASLAEITSLTAFHTAIIATSSLPRRAVFEALVSLHTVKNVIFEKVLFPRIEDYSAVSLLLEKKGVTAYVNCVRRVSASYAALREELTGAKNFFFSMRGGDWGLACNGIHMVDLFSFLAGSPQNSPVFCSGILLEDRLFQSKRPGYVEFYGKVVGSLGEKAFFSIECSHGPSPAEIEIYTDTTYYCIHEAEGTVLSQQLDSAGSAVRGPLDLPLISHSTTQVVDRLFSGQPSGLTEYKESVKLHLALLREFIKKRNALLGTEDDLCPIT